LSESELDELLRLRPAEELFSWKSPSARALGVQPGIAPAELRRLMLAEPRLIRRPLLRIGSTLLVGFDRAAWQRALGASA
jgi:arsenate reductase-like glutaredoxin family protein